MSPGVCDQVRLKPAYSATGASMRLEILVTETRDTTLSSQRTTKALIRLRGCAGWSAPLLFAYDIRHVFSWPGSYTYNNYFICLEDRSSKLRKPIADSDSAHLTGLQHVTNYKFSAYLG